MNDWGEVEPVRVLRYSLADHSVNHQYTVICYKIVDSIQIASGQDMFKHCAVYDKLVFLKVFFGDIFDVLFVVANIAIKDTDLYIEVF